MVILKSMFDSSNIWVIWVWFNWLFSFSALGCSFLCIPRFFYCIPDICCRKTVETEVSSITPRKERAFTIRPINMGGWVNLLRNPAGFWLCLCYHLLEYSRDFRFLYQWAAVIFCLMWELDCVGVVSVLLFHTRLSAVPVWSISPTFWHSPVIDSVAYYLMLMMGTREYLTLGLESGCVHLSFRDRGVSVYSIPQTPAMDSKLQNLSMLDLGWEKVFYSFTSGRKPLLCIGARF